MCIRDRCIWCHIKISLTVRHHSPSQHKQILPRIGQEIRTLKPYKSNNSTIRLTILQQPNVPQMLQIMLVYDNTATFHRLIRSTPQMTTAQLPTHTTCQRLCRRSAVYLSSPSHLLISLTRLNWFLSLSTPRPLRHTCDPGWPGPPTLIYQ